MPQNIQWNKFNELETGEELDNYLSGREYRHGDYCHYTRLSIVDSILDKKQLWLGCVSGFNDNLDTQQFGDEQELCYSLCFSTGINENLALWYLYAGMNGQGARLRFTKSSIGYLINNATFSLYRLDNDSQRELPQKVADLEKGKDFQLSFKDIIYYKDNGDTKPIDMKYNTMTNHIMPKEEFDKYLSSNIGFCKGLIWYFEKETRLLIKLTGTAASLVKNLKGKFVVILELDEEMYRKIKIDFAPEVTNVQEAIRPYIGIKNFILDTSHAKLSCYSGTLHMDLCKKCDNNINSKKN